MILKIHKNPYHVWWSRLFNKYKITNRSRLLIDGRLHYIDGFDGKLSRVYIDDKLHRIGIKKTREYRYAALEQRRTLCNHDKLSNKYRFDIKNPDCEYCFIYSRCSMVQVGWRKRTQVVIKDLMMVSQYFEENKEDL